MPKSIQKYDPQTTTINKLSEIGYKIFLDRYALKDGSKESLAVGDTVMVCVDLKTGQREVGTVTKKSGSQVTVKLRMDGEEITREIEHVDKPLETDPQEMHTRIAKGIASVEKSPKKRAEWEKKFLQAMEDFKFVPAGRILTGAGTNQALTYYNCYVIPSPHDSRGGIFDCLSRMAEIMSRGGGVGINLSSLRPRYDYVKGVNGRSSGSTSWGSLYSFVTGLIEQGGSRRGALMLITNVWHPDIEDFITSKTDMGKITNANISVGVTDDFMEAVKNDSDWNLIFPDKTDKDYDDFWDGNLEKWLDAGKKVKIYKTVKARDLWDKIVESAWASAEPGLFFIDRYNKLSPSSYFAPITCTNPCGEQGLPAWGVCNLGAINLSKFVDEEAKDVAWDDLRESIRIAVRFLDNVIDATPYFFEENKKQQQGERRVGLNTMGVAEMMVKLGLRYGSAKGNHFLDKLYKFFTCEAYKMSTEIAKEKGSFSKFQANKHLETGFIKTLPDEIRALIKENGLRNVTLNTQAPNGTIGTMVGTSTGIEPFYYWTYERTSRLGTHKESVEIYEKWINEHPNEELPDYFVTAMDLSPEEHISVQATIQRWIDSSISKTCNVPNEYTKEQVGELYRLMYDLGCKGGTVYRDGSRDIQVLNVSKDDADDKETAEQQVYGIIPRKRPEIMQGTTYKTNTAYGSMYVIINNDEEGKPYEIFTTLGKTGGFFAAKTEAISRLISLSLRSGVAVEEIINQLKGIRGPNPIWSEGNLVLSIPDALAGVLSRHIGTPQPELKLTFGEKEKVATASAGSSGTGIGAGSLADSSVSKSVNPVDMLSLAKLGSAPICPECGNMLVMQEGCATCVCGYSKCG